MGIHDAVVGLLLAIADFLGLAWLALFIIGRRGDQTCRFEGHEGTIRKVDVSKDGKLAASASGDHTIRVWDVATGG